MKGQCSFSTVTVLAGCLVFSLGVGGALGTVQCLACSYTFAGHDGQIDIECVNDVYNFTKTSIAVCESLCTIRTVYTQDYKRVNSISRGCGFNGEINKCNPETNVYPTCEVTCSTPKCNDQDGDLYKSMNNAESFGRFSVLLLLFAVTFHIIFI